MHAVMLDLQGLTLSAEEKELLVHPQVGGIILFTRNYESLSQLEDLLKQIRQLKLAHLLLAVDHEGGRVQRFRQGFTELPALASLGNLYKTNKDKAKQLAETHGWLMAIELRAMDIDFSFAPVLDLNKNISQVIGDRAFSDDPSIITELAECYIKGMQRAGMSSVGKHFPGHGSVEADSHIAIPVDPRSYETIASEDLVPFAQLTKQNLTGIMPAHVIYSAVDEKPAGFSKFWLQTVLRERLGFSGAIFSDDLSMQGATQMGDMQERARVAFEAGCDMVLVCNDRLGAIKVVEQLERDNFRSSKQSSQRLQSMRGRGTLTRADLVNMTEWQNAVSAMKILN